MTENLKETLSAFIDGEASEIEIHRLLRSEDAGDRSWVHYHQIRTVVRRDGALSADHHTALRDRIRAAIAEEASFDEAPPRLRRSGAASYAKPAAAFGIAASLLVAVVAGYNVNQNIDGSSASTPEPVVAESARRTGSIDVQTVSTAGAQPAPANELELQELDEETLRAVRAYLNQHDRTVRMQPVIYAEPEKK